MIDGIAGERGIWNRRGRMATPTPSRARTPSRTWTGSWTRRPPPRGGPPRSDGQRRRVRDPRERVRPPGRAGRPRRRDRRGRASSPTMGTASSLSSGRARGRPPARRSPGRSKPTPASRASRCRRPRRRVSLPDDGPAGSRVPKSRPSTRLENALTGADTDRDPAAVARGSSRPMCLRPSVGDRFLSGIGRQCTHGEFSRPDRAPRSVETPASGEGR